MNYIKLELLDIDFDFYSDDFYDDDSDYESQSEEDLIYQKKLKNDVLEQKYFYLYEDDFDSDFDEDDNEIISDALVELITNQTGWCINDLYYKRVEN